MFVGLIRGETPLGPVWGWQRFQRRDSGKSFRFRVMPLEVFQNYSSEILTTFVPENFKTTWINGKRLWAIFRAPNKLESYTGFEKKYLWKNTSSPFRVISKGSLMIQLAHHPLSLGIILHVDLLSTLFGKHCSIGSALVRYPCWDPLARFLHPTWYYRWPLSHQNLGCAMMPAILS